MVLFGEEMGWKFPYIPLDKPRCALFRLLAYIDWLAFKSRLSGDTATQYYSNTKSWYIENAPFLQGGEMSHLASPWGLKGQHPDLISIALKNLPLVLRKERKAIPRSWIKEGFYEWPKEVFISIFVIYGWLGRKCEWVESPTPEHLITWSMVEFLYVDVVSGEPWLMPRDQIKTIACDMLGLKPQSRKCQPKNKVRAVPARVNFTKLANVAKGADNWNNGDMATLVQAHYVLSGACNLSEDERKVTPVLTFPGGLKITAPLLQSYLKAKAVEHGVDPDTVTLHGLRTSGVSSMVNGPLGANTVAILHASGHASVDTQLPYQKLDQGIASLVTEAFKY